LEEGPFLLRQPVLDPELRVEPLDFGIKTIAADQDTPFGDGGGCEDEIDVVALDRFGAQQSCRSETCFDGAEQACSFTGKRKNSKGRLYLGNSATEGLSLVVRGVGMAILQLVDGEDRYKDLVRVLERGQLRREASFPAIFGCPGAPGF
jgi:hypothetical protein